MTNKYSMTTETHQELVGMLEDTVAQFCQDNMISGELSWLVAQTFATAKLEQFKGNIK
jgi:hypothetical protein